MIKRRFERVDRHLLINYDHFSLDNIKDDEGLARTLDMSVRGLLLQTPRPLEIGSTMRMALNLSDDVIDIFGEVVRCEPDDSGTYEVGIELKYVPEKYITSIEDYFGNNLE